MVRPRGQDPVFQSPRHFLLTLHSGTMTWLGEAALPVVSGWGAGAGLAGAVPLHSVPTTRRSERALRDPESQRKIGWKRRKDREAQQTEPWTGRGWLGETQREDPKRKQSQPSGWEG